MVGAATSIGCDVRPQAKSGQLIRHSKVAIGRSLAQRPPWEGKDGDPACSADLVDQCNSACAQVVVASDDLQRAFFHQA